MQELDEHEDADAFVETLRQVAENLERLEYRDARESASELSEYAFCDICERISETTQAAVLYATGFAPDGRARRAKQVAAEIRWLLDGGEPADYYTGGG